MKTANPPILPICLLSTWLGLAHCLAAVVQGEPTVTERGPHQRVWSRQDVRTLPDGRAVTNDTSFIELGSGIHCWDQPADRWMDGEAVIELEGNGAVARREAHQVTF